ANLIEIPSRFLRANRDHPRLFFLSGCGVSPASAAKEAGGVPRAPLPQPFLIADLHARNFVRGSAGALHVIDLVAAPWPVETSARDPWMCEWFERVRANPAASALPAVRDEEL